MTPRKPVNPDAIMLEHAAALLGMSEVRETRLRREGLLIQLEGYPSYSLTDVQEFVENPWINGRQASIVLGVSHTRVSQLAESEKIPVHLTASGQRVYRLQQLEVVAHARKLRQVGVESLTDPTTHLCEARPIDSLRSEAVPRTDL